MNNNKLFNLSYLFKNSAINLFSSKFQFEGSNPSNPDANIITDSLLYLMMTLFNPPHNGAYTSIMIYQNKDYVAGIDFVFEYKPKFIKLFNSTQTKFYPDQVIWEKFTSFYYSNFIDALFDSLQRHSGKQAKIIAIDDLNYQDEELILKEVKIFADSDFNVTEEEIYQLYLDAINSYKLGDKLKRYSV